MSRSEDKSWKWVVLLLPIVLLLYGIHRKVIIPYKQKARLIEYSIQQGVIIEVYRQRFTGGSISAKYKYEVRGDTYQREFGYHLPCKGKGEVNHKAQVLLVGKSIPIAVSKSDPSFAMPLIRTEEFNRINLDFPDSLRNLNIKYLDCYWKER